MTKGRVNGKGFEVTIGLVADCFYVLTCLTGVDKGVDEFGHAGPEEGPTNQGDCLSVTGVTR